MNLRGAGRPACYALRPVWANGLPATLVTALLNEVRAASEHVRALTFARRPFIPPETPVKGANDVPPAQAETKIRAQNRLRESAEFLYASKV